MNIAAVDARALFYKTVIDVYTDRLTPTSFFRSFFPTKEVFAKTISIEVRRMKEKIAVDVLRGTEGNRNTFNYGNEKQFLPPYFREFIELTDFDVYDRVFGKSDTVDTDVLSLLIDQVAEKMAMIQDSIERAYEYQCSQALHTGVVTMESGDNIDFKRKAASIVDLNTAGGYFTNNAVNPFAAFENAGKFIRQVGKASMTTGNAICGGDAFTALIENTKFKDRQNLLNLSLDQVREPQKNSVGASLMGYITAGSYKFNLWTYPEYFDNAAGVSTPYMEEDKIIILPEAPRFSLTFAAVPQLPDDGSIKKGAYIFGEFKDPRKKSHVLDIASAGVPVISAVDQCYTMKVK